MNDTTIINPMHIVTVKKFKIGKNQYQVMLKDITATLEIIETGISEKKADYLLDKFNDAIVMTASHEEWSREYVHEEWIHDEWCD